MKPHRISQISFSADRATCSCGATTRATPESFTEHRKAAGAGRGYLSQAHATPDTPSFIRRRKVAA